jgi:RNA polymerase sigma factor (sigma-70 family)
MDLNELIAQLRRGEPAAGPVLVSVIAPRLMGYVQMIAPHLSAADHEAIVEVAIEKAITKIDLYQPDRATFPTWVRGFVRSELTEWIRAHPSGPTVELPPYIENVAAQSDTTEDAFSSDRVAAALASVVLTESEGAQLLLRLKYGDGLTHEQIAKQLGVTAAACRKRLERLLVKLRHRARQDPDLKKLDPDGEPPTGPQESSPTSRR